MAMPTRFSILTDLEEEPNGKPRQPVPAQFQHKEAMNGEEYFQWLYKEVSELREPFIEQISRAVRNFNDATWPKDLGLAKKKYPFRIWRGKQKLAVLDENAVVSVGEVLEHTRTVNTRTSATEVAFEHCFVIAEDADESQFVTQNDELTNY